MNEQTVSIEGAVVPVGHVIDRDGRVYSQGQTVPKGAVIADVVPYPDGAVSRATWKSQAAQTKAIEKALFGAAKTAKPKAGERDK